jgi:hypothetical protein
MEKKYKKQFVWVVLVILAVFAVFLGTYLYIASLGKFKYDGVHWETSDYNGAKLYHSIFPIQGTDFNVYFWTDPRKNNISVNVTDFKFYPDMVVSLQPEAGACMSAQMAGVNLGQFLGAAKRRVTGAVTDKQTAKELTVPYVTCADAGNQTVIVMQKSDIPSIEQQGDCYIINVGDCENQPAVEKFIGSIISSISKNPANSTKTSSLNLSAANNLSLK